MFSVAGKYIWYSGIIIQFNILGVSSKILYVWGDHQIVSCTKSNSQVLKLANRSASSNFFRRSSVFLVRLVKWAISALWSSISEAVFNFRISFSFLILETRFFSFRYVGFCFNFFFGCNCKSAIFLSVIWVRSLN